MKKFNFICAFVVLTLLILVVASCTDDSNLLNLDSENNHLFDNAVNNDLKFGYPVILSGSEYSWHPWSNWHIWLADGIKDQ